MAAYVSAPAFAESDYVYNSVGGDPYIYEVGGANPLVRFSKQCAQTLRMEYAYQFLLVGDVTTTGWNVPVTEKEENSDYAKGRPLFWDGTLHYFTTHEDYQSAEGHTKASLSFKDCEYGLFGAGIRNDPDAKDNRNGAVGNVTFDNLRCLEISGIKAADREERVLTAYRELPGGIIYLDRLDFENTFTITNVSDDDNSTTYDVIFANNTSDRGTIYADYVTLSGNGGINFSANTALKDRGGAISATKEVSITNNTGEILFESNKTIIDGSAIYSADSILLGANQGSIIFKNNEGGSTISAQNDIVIKDNTGSTIYFSGNKSTGWDGSVLHSKAGNILVEGNESYITFTNNTCSGYYGVISAEAGSVTFKNNKAAINFNENTACDWKGAAIYSASGVNFEGNEDVYFFKNASTSTNGLGGAIYNESGLVSFSNNEDVNFAYNQATFTGGAIYANGKDDEGVSVSMKGNACVTFDHNEALEEDKRWGIGGGAIYAVGSVSLSDNKRVDGTDGKSGVFFTYNTAGTDGGAIYSDSKVSLTGNGAIKFDNNTATTGAGGAIRGVREITITDNAGNIEFKGNTAGTTGGAIHNETTLDDYKQQWVRINRNTGDISFTGNKAGTNGGAIDMGHMGGLELLDNTGSITFSDNTAVGIGGAIYTSCGEGVLIENNTGDVTFRNNRAGSKAGAIYSGAYPNEIGLSIRNNGNVLFEKNAVVDDSGNYILRSYQHNDDFRGGDVLLSAADGKYIEFRDSIAGDVKIDVNEAYNGVEQTGDVVFTGYYTEKHLNELLQADGVNRQATADEINASRQSAIGGKVVVHGGRLRVEDGAVLSTSGLQMKENAGATLLVKNATVRGIDPNGNYTNKGDGSINITSGNTLQVEGPSEMDEMSALMFTLAEAQVEAGSLNTTIGAVLDTDTLTLHSGSSLVLDKSHIDLDGGCLTLNMLGEDKINLGLTLDGLLMEDSIVMLFSNIGTLKLGSDLQYTGTDTFEFNANQYFTGAMIGENTMVQFQNGSMSVTGLVTPMIPEPTTATLSLLALAGLAARRRRK